MAAPVIYPTGVEARLLRMEANAEPLPAINSVYNIPLSATNIATPSQSYPLLAPLDFTKGILVSNNANTIQYNAVGRCIYCGSRLHSQKRAALGEEHIIAEALGAAIVLLGSSCEEHERHTSRIETRLLQRLFDPSRKHLKIGRSILKSKFEVSRNIDGINVTVRLPISDHPTILFLPHLAPPAILTERPRLMHGITGMWIVNLNATDALLRKLKMRSVATPGVDTVLFTQLLCKIAFSFAVAEMTLENFAPICRDYLLTDFGKLDADERRYEFVGGQTSIAPPTPHLHELGLGLNKFGSITYLVARIRLLAFLGAPVYYVAVGTVPEEKIAAATARLSRNNSRTQAR